MLKKIELQEEIERTWNKEQLYDLMGGFLVSCNVIEFLEEKELDVNFCMKALTLLGMHQRLEPSALIGMLRGFRDTVQEVADEVQTLVEHEFITYNIAENLLESVAPIPPVIQEKIKDFQFLPPMIVPPKEVKDNDHIGYLTYKRTPLLGGRYHTEDISLDVINKMNTNNYAVSVPIYNMCANKFKNENIKNKKTKYLFDTRMYRVVDLMFQTGNSFYFCWSVDYRGRVYPRADTLTAQGNDYGKAILEWAEPEAVDLDAIM